MNARERLNELKRLWGLRTDEELAKRLNVPKNTINTWVGRRSIPAKWELKIEQIIPRDCSRTSYNISATINNSKNSSNNIAITGADRPASSQSHDEELLARFCELYRNYRTPKMEQSLLELIEKLEAVRQATE